MSDGDIGVMPVDIIASMRTSFEALIARTAAAAQGDVKAYAQQLAQEFVHFLERARKGDADAVRTLEHLKAQVPLIAVKRGIIMHRELAQEIERNVILLASFALRVLVGIPWYTPPA